MIAFSRARLVAGAAAVLLACMLSPRAVSAAEPAAADRALATDLFDQARALAADAKVAEACPKFAESQRLDPSLGTLLNLANCHELEGKIATAWSEFNEARAIAERERQPDRVAFAETHIALLARELPRLVIVVPPELEGTDLEVTRDGSSVARVALGTAMPIDPGNHRIEVKARGYEPWSAEVDIAAGARRELTVGPLTPLPALGPPVPVAMEPMPGPAPLVPEASDQPRGRIVGVALSGAGIVAVAVGTVAGIVAISKSSTSESRCTPRCTEEGYSLNQDAKTAADVATVSFVVGAVALTVGVLLYVTSRPADRGKAAFARDGAAASFRF